MILRDAVHGDIELTADEVRILDTPEVQRLRGVKQLGAANYVYPSALHTRFEHSLGTLHCAQKILDSLASKHEIAPQLQKIIRVGALLHDVAHLPFGHTFEDERRLMPRHDKGHRFLAFVQNTPLGERLQQQGILEAITAIAEEQPLPEVPQWARQIISSTIDADLLDYLKRDNYFTGLSQNYDERIYKSFIIKDGELGLNMVKKGFDRQDALTEIMNLLRLRYFLTERVYYHHTKIIAGSMISKAFESVLQQGFTETEIHYKSDQTFLEYIAQQNQDSKVLVQAVLERNLYKRAFTITYANCPSGVPERLIEEFSSSIERRSIAETQIAKLAGVSPKEVILYCSGLPTNKEASVKVLSLAGWHPFNRVGTLKTYQEIAMLDSKFKNLWKLFILTPQKNLTNVARASESFFQLTNELHRE